jgi:hypothetical protein
MIFSLVGLPGVFTGMLSGLVALAAPEAAAGGGFTIGVCGCGATAWACAVTAKAVEITSTKAVLALRVHAEASSSSPDCSFPARRETCARAAPSQNGRLRNGPSTKATGVLASQPFGKS